MFRARFSSGAVASVACATLAMAAHAEPPSTWTIDAAVASKAGAACIARLPGPGVNLSLDAQ
jgi:hypothetical protein